METDPEREGPAPGQTAADHGLPAPVRDGLVALQQLPGQVVAALWPMLELALTEPENPDSAQHLRRFAAGHGVDERGLLAAVRACDYLLRHAAALGLEADRFDGELAALAGEDARRLLAAHYPAARRWLREQALVDTLADHGNVLTGMDWRVDQVRGSHRAQELDSPVLFLRLHYRNGTDRRELPLQLTAEAAAQLQSLCERFSR